MTRYNHKIFTILIFAGLVFLFLGMMSPFMHNHKADFDLHEDCMVYRMEATIFMVVLGFTLVFIAIIRVTDVIGRPLPIVPDNQFIHNSIQYRAPPF